MRCTFPCVRAPLFHPPATASLHPPMAVWLDELELVPPSLDESSLEMPSAELSLDEPALQTLSLPSASFDESPLDEAPPFDEASLEQTLLEESSSNVTVSSRRPSTG
jgi:hypothetical protein